MKITRAMELIATSRILKAQQRVEAARPYAERLTAAIADVATASADALIERFTAGDVDEIHGVFTDFVSAIRQRPVARRFVPMVFEETERPPTEGPVAQYIFEPDPEALLEALLPRYVETRVYNALLESAASEHAARRRAMSAATENAEELVKVLTRVANQARQTEITTEIMEIVGGAEALA